MTILKKIDVLSLAKFQALLLGLMGLIIGLIYALAATVLSSFINATELGLGLGFSAIIILPISYAIMGFITGAIGAALYNVVAGWIGGIKIELE